MSLDWKIELTSIIKGYYLKVKVGGSSRSEQQEVMTAKALNLWIAVIVDDFQTVIERNGCN